MRIKLKYNGIIILEFYCLFNYNGGVIMLLFL